MKRGIHAYYRGFAIIAIILSIFIIVFNFYIYNYYLKFTTPINAHASNNADISFIVETSSLTYPQISITNPESITYTSHRTELDYIVSGANLDVCKYSLNLGVTNTTITCGENVSGIISVEGSNTWTVYANNTVGGANSSSVTFLVSIPTPSVTPSGGGGGGAIAPISLLRDFDVTPAEFNIFAVSGEQIEKEIKLINKGKIGITIDISLSGINDIVALNTNQISLGKDEQESVFLILKAPKEGIFAGKIIFSSGDISKEVLVLINVRSEKKLFDVSLISSELGKTILIGEDLNTFVSLARMGLSGEVNTTINYIIKDFEGNILFIESESFLIYENKDFAKEFMTSSLSPGDYIAGIEVIYPGGFATSSIHFIIVEKISIYWSLIAIVLAILSIIIIIYSVIIYKRAGRHEYPTWKIIGVEKR